MVSGEHGSAAALARKDTPNKRKRGKSDEENSSERDADGAAQVEELKKKERELKHLREDNGARWQRKTPRRKLNWLSWQAIAIHTR